MFTKKQALKVFGSSRNLAKAFGVTPGRISQLEDEKPLPELYQLKMKYELDELKRKVFS